MIVTFVWIFLACGGVAKTPASAPKRAAQHARPGKMAPLPHGFPMTAADMFEGVARGDYYYQPQSNMAPSKHVTATGRLAVCLRARQAEVLDGTEREVLLVA